VETSRGCWWGQKHHCTFCGLNGLGMGYRSKSFNRVMLELAALADHHKLRKFEIVDNILDMSYFETVLLQLTTLNDKYVLFFETKANLRRAHIRRLAEAGVTWIQPGIESLQDNFLKLINKGTTALINVQLMKWCREYGIRLSWSILSGAPGEHDEWYTEMASWLPLVVHLQPPNGLMGIRYDRFSPYFIHPDTYGISLVPCRSYAFVYPVSQAALYELAYFFEDCKDLDATQIHPYEQRVQLMQPGLDQVRAQVEEWVRLFWEGLPPILSMTDNGTSLRILDTRPCAMNRFHHLKGLARDIYLACDEATAALALIDALSKVCYPEVLWGDIAPVIDQLKQNKLLLELNDKFLSLAVQGSVPTLPPLKNFPGGCFNLSKQADAQSIAKS
jgi:ribosomal peptide maturation radical SAM protein 1